MASNWDYVREGQTVVGPSSSQPIAANPPAASLPKVMYRSLAAAAATPGGSVRGRGGSSRRGGREQDRIPLHTLDGNAEEEVDAASAASASSINVSPLGGEEDGERRKSRLHSGEQRWLLAGAKNRQS